MLFTDRGSALRRLHGCLVGDEEIHQVVDLLKKQGKTVEVVYYPHEGHGFAKRENQIDSLRRTVEWFDKYLKGAPAE
jgi:dipeptidyl aminopeptidase/acylaminoacyl peptidase